MTIDSEFEELICIECKMSSLTWKLESPQIVVRKLETQESQCFIISLKAEEKKEKKNCKTYILAEAIQAGSV